MNQERLLKFGYFPKELPPPFTTRQFGEFASDEKFPELNDKYVSRPCLHNLARPGSQRRVLSIPNPFNYFLLAKLLGDHESTIKACLRKSTISFSTPLHDDTNYRAYKPLRDGDDLARERARIRSGARFIVRADISRFYHSIYTHSIPWAIDGKTKAKGNTKDGFANQLDRLIRNAQDRQTLGIPVGPDASFIISEIICSAIDEKIQEGKHSCFRFIDDYEFGFLNRSDAERTLPHLESILQDFELALNPTKSRVDELPVNSENSWRLAITRFSLSPIIGANQLLEFFDLLFDLYNANRSEPILRYGIARLRSSHFNDYNVLLDLLFQCILVEPGTLKEALFLIQRLEIPIDRTKLKEIIINIISIHAPMRHGSEVAWALWTAIWFNIRIPYSALECLSDYDDSVIAMLTLHAVKKNLFSKKVYKFWSHYMNEKSLIDGHWLLAYEAELKRWLPVENPVQNHILNDKNFKTLRKNKISFYNEKVNYLVSEDQLEDDYNNDSATEEDDDDDDS